MTRITQIPSDDRVSGASGAWFLAARLCLAAVFLKPSGYRSFREQHVHPLRVEIWLSL